MATLLQLCALDADLSELPAFLASEDAPPLFYVAERDQASVTAARNWWPLDAPATLSWSTALAMATNHRSGRQYLLDGLGMVGTRVSEWLVSEGRDPRHPNETGKERGARKAREAVARSRALATSTDPRAQEVRRLHAEYMAVCAARKAALAAAHDLHDPLVRAAMDAWHQAKAELDAGA